LPDVLYALAHDVEICTQRPHKRFLRIGAWANGYFIPDDAVLDVADDPKMRKSLERCRRKEARKLARQQQRKADSVIKVASPLLKAAHANIE
jgi:hypothetical protein